MICDPIAIQPQSGRAGTIEALCAGFRYLEQATGVAEGDLLSIGLRKPRAVHQAHRIVIAHVERKVGAQHQPLGANHRYQRLDHVSPKHASVEPQSLQITGWRLCGEAFHLGTNLPRVIHATGIEWIEAAAMGYHQVEFGMSIEHTAENEMRNGDRLLDRLANAVDHEELAKPLAMREAQRMHEERHAQPRQARIERIEDGIRQFEILD